MFSAAFVIAYDIFFLIFLAALFALFLNRLAEYLERWTGLSNLWGVSIVLVLLTTLLGGFFWLFGTRIEQQISGAISQLEKASETVSAELEQRPSLAYLLGIRSRGKSGSSSQKNANSNDAPENRNPNKGTAESGDAPPKNDQAGEASEDPGDGGKSEEDPGSSSSGDGLERVATVAVNGMKKLGASSTAQHFGSIISGASKFFRTTFGLLGSLGFVLLVGIFIAFEPKLYRAGIIRVFPVRHRELTSRMLDELHDTSWHWMMGRMATMTLTGAGTGLVLWIIGVPMAGLLGVVTALLTFFPNFGGIAALFLAVAFAAPMGWYVVLIVIIAYLVFQFLESNILTPMIQKHQAAIPPAVLLSTQLLMGGLFGFMGVVVAEPTAALGLHLTKRLYVQRGLEGLNVPEVGDPQPSPS